MQTNVPQAGPLRRTAAEDLTGKSGFLVYLDTAGKYALATAAVALTGAPLYVLTDDGTEGAQAEALPLSEGLPVRVQSDAATVAAGDALEIGAAGTVRTATTGEIIGFAMQAGDASSDVLIMPKHQVNPVRFITPAQIVIPAGWRIRVATNGAITAEEDV